MKRRIVIFLSLQEEACARHLQALLATIKPGLGVDGFGSIVEVQRIPRVENDQQEVLDVIEDYFARDPAGLAVLVSDWITHPNRPLAQTQFALACSGKFRMDALGIIAVMPRPCRVPDIDRSISPRCDGAALDRVLKLVIARLDYVSIPNKRNNFDGSRLCVRTLKNNNEVEFKKYFRLRHQIYSVMGYLETDVEECRSQLEINEGDTHAVHVGAFYREEGGVREHMIGTARVVTNHPAEPGLLNLFERMAAADPVLKKQLRSPYGLGLPIFQSHDGMDEIMRDIIQKDSICGELSRVTVAQDFRGCGIARKLVDTALGKAIGRQVECLFLECLDLHERIYEAHGFKRIDGVFGPVVDVKRTMIAMQMDSARVRRIARELVNELQGATQARTGLRN